MNFKLSLTLILLLMIFLIQTLLLISCDSEKHNSNQNQPPDFDHGVDHPFVPPVQYAGSANIDPNNAGDNIFVPTDNFQPPNQGVPGGATPDVFKPPKQRIPQSLKGGGVNLEELKKQIKQKVKNPKDLPIHFSASSVFANHHLKELQFEKNTVIADIGSGTGAYEVELLINNRTFSKIYAVDVNADSLTIMEFLLDQYFQDQKNRVEIVHSLIDDVKLPENSIDVAIFNDAHFFVSKPGKPVDPTVIACLASLLKAMKKGGNVYVYENRQPIGGIPKTAGPSLDDELKRMIEPFINAGFKKKTSSSGEGILFAEFLKV